MTMPDAENPIGSMTSALLAQGALYGQLAWIELEVERQRLQKMVLAMLIGFSMLTCLLLFIAGFAVFASWQTDYRYPTLVLLAFVWSLGTYYAWCRLQAYSKAGSDAFADTREELMTDMALIRTRLEQ
jgi:uncharacterized membrane protein YqjE